MANENKIKIVEVQKKDLKTHQLYILLIILE